MKVSTTALLVSFSVVRAVAAQEDVFSRTYVRVFGAPPVTETAQFAVCDRVGPFTLVVTNGPGGTFKAGSGAITVNGTEIVHPSDFGRPVTRIERTLASLQDNNNIGVRLGGQPGGTILVTVREVQACAMRITSPAAGTVTGPEVLVKGTYPSSFGLDLGVTVNGFRGLAGGGRFAALVPVDPLVTALTAVAKNVAGTTLGDATIPVTVQAGPDEAPVGLRATPVIGIVPFSVEMTLVSTVAVTHVAVDKDGDGSPDFEGPTLEGVRFTYGQPGVYLATATATTPGGPELATVIVQAYDRPSFEALLQARWAAMKNALREGNLEGALLFVSAGARERYRQALEAIAGDLPQIDAILLALTFVRAWGPEVLFEMQRSDDGVQKNFEVRFALDADGVWRLRAF